ncbi:hypothetical protein Hanom_Chr14g01267241 [Helianthus anomalus]
MTSKYHRTRFPPHLHPQRFRLAYLNGWVVTARQRCRVASLGRGIPPAVRGTVQLPFLIVIVIFINQINNAFPFPPR